MSNNIPSKLVIASRRSPLAQAQAKQIADALVACAVPLGVVLEVRIKTFVTSGDRHHATPLADMGGKGLFTKEVENALLEGAADLAVHSMKDMPVEASLGLTLAATPSRGAVEDSFVSKTGVLPWDLPKAARVGTSSARRAAQLRHRRPDLQIVPVRGNVGSRLEKLEQGVMDGTFLAEAGLQRLGLSHVKRVVLDPQKTLPALCQGTLYVQHCTGPSPWDPLLVQLHCTSTSMRAMVERAFLQALDGTCHSPIAGLAWLVADRLYFEGQILSPDGQQCASGGMNWAVSDLQADNNVKVQQDVQALAQKLTRELASNGGSHGV